jgi:hypothetical protein
MYKIWKLRCNFEEKIFKSKIKLKQKELNNSQPQITSFFAYEISTKKRKIQQDIRAHIADKLPD